MQGRLGYRVQGVYRVGVEGDAARVYVRTDDGGIAVARHDGRVPPTPDLRVELEPDDGEWVIARAIAGQTAAGEAITAPGGAAHTHARFSGLEFPIDDRLWAKLAARPLSIDDPAGGLRVTVTGGRYDARGAPRGWPGGVIDLAPLVPASGSQAWIVVGIDPVASPAALVAVSGAAAAVARDLLPDEIFDTPFDWTHAIAVCAVRLRAGQTTLGERDFEALLQTARPLGLHPPGRASGYTPFSSLSERRTGDVNTLTLAQLAEIVGTLIADLKTAGVIEG